MQSTLQTPGFAHYSIAWSPFIPNRLAVASSANYGLVGNGRLHVIHLDQSGLRVEKSYVLSHKYIPSAQTGFRFDTQDGLYDLAWSEIHENQAVVASGDGSIKLFDITLTVSSSGSSIPLKITIL